MDKAINGARAEADAALNALRDRVKSVYDATGKQIDEAAERQKQARINILAGEYEAVAPDLMELIPLEVFIAKNPKLVSRDKRFTGDKACDLLDEIESPTPCTTASASGKPSTRQRRTWRTAVRSTPGRRSTRTTAWKREKAEREPTSRRRRAST